MSSFVREFHLISSSNKSFSSLDTAPPAYRPPPVPLDTLYAPSRLPTAFSSSRVVRNGTRLQLDGEDFKVVGRNVYSSLFRQCLLRLPTLCYVSMHLKTDPLSSVATIRSQTLGISVGTGLDIENSLNTFKANDSAAWDAVDFAVFAARSCVFSRSPCRIVTDSARLLSYNLRLILPLTDQYAFHSLLVFRHDALPAPASHRFSGGNDYR